jgi:hypothetical protein
LQNPFLGWWPLVHGREFLSSRSILLRVHTSTSPKIWNNSSTDLCI